MTRARSRALVLNELNQETSCVSTIIHEIGSSRRSDSELFSESILNTERKVNQQQMVYSWNHDKPPRMVGGRTIEQHNREDTSGKVCQPDLDFNLVFD